MTCAARTDSSRTVQPRMNPDQEKSECDEALPWDPCNSPMTKKCAMAEPSTCPPDMVVFYLGDGTVCGTHEAASAQAS